jgi:hypothetical protein
MMRTVLSAERIVFEIVIYAMLYAPCAMLLR